MVKNNNKLNYQALNRIYELLEYGKNTNRKFIVSLIEENNLSFLKEKFSRKIHIIDSAYPGTVPKGYHYCKITVPKQKTDKKELNR